MIGIILFALLALIAVVAAVGMLISSNAVHSALFLVINFSCVALFYLGLNAPFVAMVQITVYTGAIMVLFLFVIMLLGAERVPLSSRLRWQAPLAVLLAVLLLGVTAFILLSPQVGVSIANPTPLGEVGIAPQGFGSPANVGEILFTRYLLPFQLVGVLLLVAMVGAVVITKDEKLRPKEPHPAFPPQTETDTSTASD